MTLTTTSEQPILEKVKQGPYFSLRVIPDSEIATLSFEEARKSALDAKVSLRGWDFPHVDMRQVFNGPEYIFGVVDWHRHLELWRLYLSGQFVYLGNLWDVLPEFQERLRRELEQDFFEATDAQKRSVVGLTSFIGLIYSVTEFYVFTARLAERLRWPTSVVMKCRLKNIDGWALGAGDPSLIWHSYFQSKVKDIDLSKTVLVTELVAEPQKLALNSIKVLFAGFNWNDASENMIRQWQTKLLAGRFAF